MPPTKEEILINIGLTRVPDAELAKEGAELWLYKNSYELVLAKDTVIETYEHASNWLAEAMHMIGMQLGVQASQQQLAETIMTTVLEPKKVINNYFARADQMARRMAAIRASTENSGRGVKSPIPPIKLTL